MKQVCINCPYNKGYDNGNACGNDICVQECRLFDYEVEK